jgi:hypothetical protein
VRNSFDHLVGEREQRPAALEAQRLSGLAPEFVSLAESRTKALNAAYSEAMRACHGEALMPTGCNLQ